MFEYSFVPTGKTSRPLYAAIACVGEALVLGVLILVPMWFYQVLPAHDLYRAMLLAPVPAAPLPPPPPMLVAAARAARPAAPRQFNPEGLFSPVRIPKAVAVIIEDAPALEQVAGMIGGVPGGLPAGIPGGVAGGMPGVTIAPPPPAPPPVAVAMAPSPPAMTPKRITVGGEVESAMLLEQPAPVYPLMAKQARIRGSVVLKAIIGVDGKVKDLVAVSGHPFLVQAAVEAVRKWIYRPTVLDGVPVEVDTTIEVRFGLRTT
jgi:periplasmic protein TonB